LGIVEDVVVRPKIEEVGGGNWVWWWEVQLRHHQSHRRSAELEVGKKVGRGEARGGRQRPERKKEMEESHCATCLVVCLTCHTMQKKKVVASNSTPHFDTIKRILLYFYKSLTGETKLVG
jgi:hypothetical protein